jgi:3-hydroxybutyrate dehydrogenase
LAADGTFVALVDIDQDRGLSVAGELGGVFVQSDLRTRQGCKDAVVEVVERCGRLDILVNNAGFQHITPLPDFPEDTWDDMLALLLTAPFLLTKYAWENLKRSGQGRIVNIGSVHSLRASPYKVAYVSAKHGLLGLMRVAALEGAPHGITCNTICPAYVRTALVEQQVSDQARTRAIPTEEVEQKVFLERAAIKRLLEPDDVGRYVSFLASEAAWGITGSVQTIDLGWTAM